MFSLKIGEGKIINNYSVTMRVSLRDITATNYGIKKFISFFFEKRAEILFNKKIFNYSLSSWFCFLSYYGAMIPLSSSIKSRMLANIFFLDLINSYKGWRHLRGLPSRGQRTWTNANASYKNNLVLRHLKLLQFKKILGNLSINEVTVSLNAESVNLLWKNQWEHEWREAKKKRIFFLQKNSVNYKVDLFSASKCIVGGFNKKYSKSKQQKTNSKNNSFTVGFDFGFTKGLFQDKNKSGSLVTNLAVPKKKKIKKKTESSGGAIKKKKKKDQWD